MGLAAWIGIGVVLAVVARLLLPGGDRGCLTLFAATSGALAGGIGATVLGVGGALDLDPLGLAIAAMAAVIALLLLRLIQGRGESRPPRGRDRSG